MKNNCTLFFLLFLLGIGCQKEVSVDNTDKKFPLQLSVSTTPAAGSIFSWDEVKVAGFQKYVLVRSGSTIPAGETPTSNGKFKIFETSDYSEYSVQLNSGLVLDATIHYKLYALVNDRWLESQEVLINNENINVSGIPLAAYFYPDSNWILILKVADFNVSQGQLVLADMNNNKVYTSIVPIPVNTFEMVAMSVIVDKHQPEAFVGTSTSMRRFSMPSLALIGQYSNASSPFSVAGGGKGVLFTTNGLLSFSFNVRKMKDFSLIKSNTQNNYFEPRTLAVLDTTTNLVLMASTSRIDLFNVDPNNGIIFSTGYKFLNTGIGGVFEEDIPVSPDHQLFMPDRSGIVYNRNLDIVGSMITLNTFNLFLNSAAFSPDGQYVYAVIQNSFTNETTLIKKKTSDFSTVSTLDLTNNIVSQKIGRLNAGIHLIISESSGFSPRFSIQNINF